MGSNWFFQWDNNNRNRPECMSLIAKGGNAAYGLYARVREVIATNDGECSVDVVCSQLGCTPADLQILIDNKCYHFVSGLLSDPAIKEACERRRIISEKRASAGKKGMSERWDKPKKAASRKRSTAKASKNGAPVLEFENEKNSGITNVTNNNSNIVDDDKSSSSNTDKKKDPITNVIEPARKLYVDFHVERTGADPMNSAAGNKGLRTICTYLQDQVRKAHPDEPAERVDKLTIESFGLILKNWSSWGNYESGKIRLQDIASNLTNIIAHIKSANNGTKKSTNGHHVNGSSSRVASSISAIDNIEL